MLRTLWGNQELRSYTKYKSKGRGPSSDCATRNVHHMSACCKPLLTLLRVYFAPIQIVPRQQVSFRSDCDFDHGERGVYYIPYINTIRSRTLQLGLRGDQLVHPTDNLFRLPLHAQ